MRRRFAMRPAWPMILGLVAACLGAAVPVLADPPGAQDLEKLPLMVRDTSSVDWIVDRFAGNSTAGEEFYQGPARQAGGLGRPRAMPLPDGSVALFHGRAAYKVSPEGTLELVRQDGWFSPIEGPMEVKFGGNVAMLEGKLGPNDVLGDPFDAAAKAYYSVLNCCIRKATVRPDGSLLATVVAGTPYKPGTVDGPGKTALLQAEVRGVVRTSDGTLYWGEFPKPCVRRFKDGQVATLPLTFKDPPNKLGFIMSIGRIAPAENDDSLFIVDGYNYLLRRLNLKTLEVTNVAGVCQAETKNPPAWQKARLGLNSDGPALTHVHFNSGLHSAMWDPFYKAIWMSGPDEASLRWLKNGWVTSVLGTPMQEGGWDSNGVGVPASRVKVMWAHVVGTDDDGGVYFTNGANQTGVWRAYDPQAGGKPLNAGGKPSKEGRKR